MAFKRFVKIRPAEVRLGARVEFYAFCTVQIGIVAVVGGKSVAYSSGVALLCGLGLGLCLEWLYWRNVRQAEPRPLLIRSAPLEIRILLHALSGLPVGYAAVTLGGWSLESSVGIAICWVFECGLWLDWLYRRVTRKAETDPNPMTT